jgi:uncharacterized protein (DUF362 family)
MTSSGSTRSRVAVVKSSPATVLEDTARIMREAGVRAALSADHPTIIKDNISWHLYFPGANTTPWQLEATLRTLQEEGFGDIVGVHNRTVVTDASLGDRKNKFREVYRRYGVPTKDNFSEEVTWSVYEPKRPLVVLDKIFPKGIEIPDMFHGKNIVHLPTVKTHVYTTTTGAMKNAFGGLLKHNRHYCHTDIHATLVDLLSIQQEIHPGIFAVMDGTICGNGAGPRAMRPEVKGYMLASSDSVAIDAVAAKMMGFDPMTIDYIRLAHERGLGCGRVEEIELVGEDIGKVNFGFHVEYHFASKVGRTLWYGPLRHIQALFFKTPLVWLFIAGSALYHDYFWYPLVAPRRMAQAVRSEWGELFASYPE